MEVVENPGKFDFDASDTREIYKRVKLSVDALYPG